MRRSLVLLTFIIFTLIATPLSGARADSFRVACDGVGMTYGRYWEEGYVTLVKGGETCQQAGRLWRNVVSRASCQITRRTCRVRGFRCSISARGNSTGAYVIVRHNCRKGARRASFRAHWVS